VINLAYDDRGSGEPVVFIAGSGGPGRTCYRIRFQRFCRRDIA